jgi:hypothetical protein
MSMLTPPGMGGKYRITGNQYPRMRRPRNHRRIALATASMVALIALIGWGTLQLIEVFGGHVGRTRASATRGPHCGRAAAPAGGFSGVLPRPGMITVNVYNATPRAGLAKTTADELRKRGFVIGRVGNAPAAYDKNVKGTAVLLGGSQAQNALKVLGAQIAAGDQKADPSRAGASDVDLIIGDGFGGLDPQPNVERALAALAHPSAIASSSAKGC